MPFRPPPPVLNTGPLHLQKPLGLAQLPEVVENRFLELIHTNAEKGNIVFKKGPLNC